jgi:hypothetical protein
MMNGPYDLQYFITHDGELRDYSRFGAVWTDVDPQESGGVYRQKGLDTYAASVGGDAMVEGLTLDAALMAARLAKRGAL